MELNERNYYESLYEIAVALNSNRASDSILRSIVQRVAQAMDTKGCSLMLLTKDKKQLLHTVAYGLSDWYVRKGPLSVDKSISEALNDKPIAVFDATEDERIQYRKQAQKEGIASILCVPVSLREEIIGVIRVYTKKPYHFTADDIFFVRAVANLGAIALENARLYESVQKDYATFRRDILEMGAGAAYKGPPKKKA
jgi:GAF domain-containing protein